MTTPAFPAQGSTDWYAWAQAVHDAASDVKDGRLSDASLKAAYVADEGNGPYLLATFGGSLDGVQEQQLCIYSSADGKNFVQSNTNPVVTSSPGMRDPSIIFRDGTFYVAVTAASFGVAVDTGLIEVWSATDPMSNQWSKIAPLDLTGVSTATDVVWAPEFFVDDDGTVHMYISVDQTHIWRMQALDATLTTWTTPVQMDLRLPDGAWLGNCIDASVIKVGTVYHMFVKRGDHTIAHGTSTSPAGVFTFAQTGNGWNGFTSETGFDYEGPIVVLVRPGHWRMYVDRTNTGYGGLYYTETSDPNLSSGWTALTPVLLDGKYVPRQLRHGTVLRLDQFGSQQAARWNGGLPRVTSGANLVTLSYNAGNIALPTSGWGFLNPNLNVVIPDCKAGDWIEMGVNALWSNAGGTGEALLDFAISKAGAIVHTVTLNASTGGVGQVSLYAANGVGLLPCSATDWYQVVDQDVATDGSVTVSLYGWAKGGGRAMRGDSAVPVRLWARKYA